MASVTCHMCITYAVLAVSTDVPSGTKQVSPLTVAIASEVRAAMASRTPAATQSYLEKETGIPQSTISRLLKPSKVMDLNQLDAICRALRVDMGELIDRASTRARDAEADEVRWRVRASSEEGPTRPAHGPNRSGARGSASTRRHGTK